MKLVRQNYWSIINKMLNVKSKFLVTVHNNFR